MAAPTLQDNVLTFNRGDATTDLVWAKSITFITISLGVVFGIREGTDTTTLFRIFVPLNDSPTFLDFGDGGFRFEGGLSFNGSANVNLKMQVFLA